MLATGPLRPGQTGEVLDLIQAAADADEVGPLSEHGMLRVRHGDPGGSDVLAIADGQIAGYAYLDEPDPAEGSEVTGELVVHPRHRRKGVGTALARELASRAQGHPVRIWAHGDLAAAAALARSVGFERFRALWQLRRSLSTPLPEAPFPAGTTLRTFRPGQDEEPWLLLNARAFAKHPEQGSWTRRDIELRENEPWFDPAGFFIAERDGTMTGFHWTKVHPDGTGEVYVVGVDPDAHGGGLGKALTVGGLRYLRDRGLPEVMLYVDEENSTAISMYEHLGFTRWRADAMYRRPRLVSVEPEHLVELGIGKRPIGRRDRAQHVGIEIDLIQSDDVVDAQIQLPRNRAHLHATDDSVHLPAKGMRRGRCFA
jgi:mycothiol synthase